MTQPNDASGDDVSRIAALQHGDAQAFTELARGYESALHRIATRIVGEAEAMDIVQEALLAAYSHISSFRGRSFEAWLARIAINRAYMVRRSARRSREVILDGQADVSLCGPEAQEPETWLCQDEVRQALAVGLGLLPREQRLIVVLRDVYGMSYTEIAVTARVPVGTVRSRLSRGRACMRDYISGHRELFAYN